MAQLLDGLHILLVEDDPDALEIAKLVMQYQGAFVLALSDAKAAILALRSMRPDVVVSDVSMPEHDGYWLIGEAKRLGLLDGVPMLALTALSQRHDRQRLLEAGFDNVIVKPFDPNALCGTVQALARRRPVPGE